MKVLVAHNFYQQAGGEDRCFAAESDLLERNGHEVLQYSVHNKAIDDFGGLKAARMAVWNRGAHDDLSALVESEKPDVVHFHNTFPLMSPAVFWAAKRHGLAVVNTLHNYRLVCPVGTLVRNDAVCEDCVGRLLPWPAMVHGCYRGSRLASSAVAAMLLTHRALGTWSDKIDLFIALTQFARRIFIEAGIPADKIALKPNFVDPDPGGGEVASGQADYALFVGRLSPEKGIDTLLAAWQRLAGKTALRIVGVGPLASQVEAAAAQSPAIEYLGFRQRAEVMALMAGASFLVVPSLWYETFGLVIVEAFANAKPAIVSRLGAMSELVRDGYTGVHFEPGDPDDLAAKVAWALEHPEEMKTMGQNARRIFVENYTAERNYHRLMDIYRQALEAARVGRH